MKTVLLLSLLLVSTCPGDNQGSEAGEERNSTMGAVGERKARDKTDEERKNEIRSDMGQKDNLDGGLQEAAYGLGRDLRHGGYNVQDSDSLLILEVRDPYSGIEEPETRIIKDAKTLHKFYSRINRTRKPGLPVPDVDFSAEIVIVRCSGTTDDGAMPSLSIKEETPNEIVIGIDEKEEDSDSSAVTTPFSVYRMPTTDKKITLHEYQ